MMNDSFIRTVVIDDPKVMKELFNEPAFSGRLQGDVFTAFAAGSYGASDIYLK
jgi:hypothetical protein